MGSSKRIIGFLITTMLLADINCNSLYAQDQASQDTFRIAVSTMHFPYYPKTSRLMISAGLSMVMPPKDMLETAIQAPLANLHMIYSLPEHFSLEGDFTTLFVSNQLSLGPAVSFSHNNLGLKAGWNVAYVLGFLHQFGFDNSTRAWIHYPNVSVGYKMKQMALTIEGDVILVSSVSTRSGDNELSTSKNFYNGFTCALYLEQRIHRNRIFSVGFKDSYLKYYWPTWMVFSTFNRYYHVPELCFSWIL